MCSRAIEIEEKILLPWVTSAPHLDCVLVYLSLASILSMLAQRVSIVAVAEFYGARFNLFNYSKMDKVHSFLKQSLKNLWLTKKSGTFTKKLRLS